MKIRKVIDHSGIGELSLHMVLATNFFFLWKSGKTTQCLFSILFNLNANLALVTALHL